MRANRPRRKPTLAVWKLASCDGCQLTLLDCEDELLDLAGSVTLAHFPEMSSNVLHPPYDISLVEGSITTQHDEQAIKRIRKFSKILVTMGACATSGGIQALRNYADVNAYKDLVYPEPGWVSSLAQSTPISAHVSVDYELRGCPISKSQLLKLLDDLLAGRKPAFPKYSVCTECKLSGTHCVAVKSGTPCLGPITQAGCGALCPRFGRGCYGCYGDCEGANINALKAVFPERRIGPMLRFIASHDRTTQEGPPQ